MPELTALLERVAGGKDAEQSPEVQMNMARRIAASFAHLPGEG